MSSSTSLLKLKFLFDENVDRRLEKAVRQHGVDVISKPKEFSDIGLAEFSRLERRVFVTNDEDFTKFSGERIFSVIWLRIPQSRIYSAKDSFFRLLKTKASPDEFRGNLIKLYEDRFEIEPLQ